MSERSSLDENLAKAVPAPATAGYAPWERSGVSAPPPGDPRSEAQKDKYEHMVRRLEERHRMQLEARQHAEEERLRAEQLERERAEADLVYTCKVMFYLGCAFMPWMWMVMVWYFWKEYREPTANPQIKRYCKIAMIGMWIPTAIMVAWFIAFQVNKDGSLKNMNILYF